MNTHAEDFNAGLVRRIAALSRPMDPLPASATPALKPLPGIKAVLLDVYGTMFISASGDIGAARNGNREDHLRDALASAGFTCVDSEAGSLGIRLLDQFIAASHSVRRREGIEHPEVELRDIWRQVVATLLDSKSVEGPHDEEAVNALAVDFECRANPVWPMPHLRETVDDLHASGRKLGVVSNAQFYTPLTLAAFPQTGWSDGCFDEKLCAWSYKLREAKPSGRLVGSVLQTLKARDGIAPPQVLCIGNDMLNDILPAARLGCRTTLFAGDARSFRPREAELRGMNVRPDLVVTDLAQIPAALI